MATEDLVRLLKGFDAAGNARDEDAVLEFFTDDAVARLAPPPPGEPEAYEGKEEIRSFPSPNRPWRACSRWMVLRREKVMSTWRRENADARGTGPPERSSSR